MVYYLFSVLRLFLGVLYPSYASYKAVRTRNAREYVKWMMYWIVFASFSLFETFSDIFIASWFPFYYEVKILILIWLIFPVSGESLGSTIIYQKIVHPCLMNREDEIDQMTLTLQEKGYHNFTKLGGRAIAYISNVLMHTAMSGGGGFAAPLKKWYSRNDSDYSSKNKQSLRFSSPMTTRRNTRNADVTYKCNEIDRPIRERATSEGSIFFSKKESDFLLYKRNYSLNQQIREVDKRTGIHQDFSKDDDAPNNTITKKQSAQQKYDDSVISHKHLQHKNPPQGYSHFGISIETMENDEYVLYGAENYKGFTGYCQSSLRGPVLVSTPSKGTKGREGMSIYGTLPRNHGRRNHSKRPGSRDLF